MNSVALIGRVVADPEIKYFESGKQNAQFNLAVNRPTKDKEADFFGIICWEKTAELVEKYVRKGKQVGIQGYLQQEKWQDKDTGKNRSKTVIIAARIDLLADPKGASGDGDYEEFE